MAIEEVLECRCALDIVVRTKVFKAISQEPGRMSVLVGLLGCETKL